MKRNLITLLLLIGSFFPPTFISPSSPPPPVPPNANARTNLENAFLEAALAYRDSVYPIPLFDIRVENMRFSASRAWATAWLVMLQPMTGEPIATEPGLAIARWDGSTWQVSLPADEKWAETLLSSPADLVTPGLRTYWLDNVSQSALAVSAPLNGYYLPWAYGKTVRLTNSTAHDAYITSGNAHYSFDFANGTMFDIHAARGGTVWSYKDTVPNGDENEPNYLVLEDTTTSPTTYQLYLHLAQGSIPPELKTIGTPVVQGQFLAKADDTGMSTGHHLHFQVEQQPYWQGYWAQSLDILFSDVSINGGRPRRPEDIPYCTWPGDVCNETAYYYTSANNMPTDPNAPWGAITTPASGYSLTANSLQLEGWAADDTAVASAQFKAYFNDTWHAIGPEFSTSPFSYTWDVCSSQVPDGPLSFSLAIRDTGGRWAQGLPGLTHVVKNYTCPQPPPQCSPAADQVALFAQPDYQGECLLLSAGDYLPADLGSLGDDTAASLLLGSSAYATLYYDADLSARGETFWSSDPNLADNTIGSQTLSSLHVGAGSDLPSPPRPVWPLDGASFQSDLESVSLAWDDGGASSEFQVEMNGVPKSWSAEPSLPPGSFAPGQVAWRVRARNPNGQSSWSATQTFSMTTPSSAPPAAVTAPFSDDMESGYNNWLNSSNWDQNTAQNHTPNGSKSWRYEIGDHPNDYNIGVPNAGSLTTPPVTIPSTGYALLFWYRYATEGSGSHWDRRWVQLSVDGSPFTNTLQLSDDPPNTWLRSPAIDLSAYAGQSVQVRFVFETLDANDNDHAGWYIDDFSIDTISLPQCAAAGEPDNDPASAQPLTYGSDVSGTICPGGDQDYYRFSAQAGDQIAASALAKTIGSSLDTYLYLLDQDGTSVLAENDDLVYAKVTDSYLSYLVPRTGDYYLKLKAWNHPSVGGPAYSYTLSLDADATPPTATLLAPLSDTFLPTGPMTLQVAAGDSDGQIGHVEFAWHDGNWASGSWETLGFDWDGSDDWQYVFDTSAIPDQQGIAFYARAFNRGGTSVGTAAWNTWLDRTPPISALDPISASQTSTAIRLNWQGSDNLAGVDHYALQVQVDNAAWADVFSSIPGDQDHTWYSGQTGRSYGFRLQAVDRVGNQEGFPASAEVSTSIPASVCSPNGDAYEADNPQAAARVVDSISVSQAHTFCNPQSGSNGLGDQDWLQLSLQAGERLLLHATPDSPSTPRLQIYAADGSTLLAEAQASERGMPVDLEYTATTTGNLFVKISDLDSSLAGDGAGYLLWLRHGVPLWLPYTGNAP